MGTENQNILSAQNKYPRLVQYLIEAFQVTDCHLVKRTNDDGNKYLVAYLVGQSVYNNKKLKYAADAGLIERTPDFIAPVTVIPGDVSKPLIVVL